MPRPRKSRRVTHVPGVTFFRPVGVPLRQLEEVCLAYEEAEAIRLKDRQGLDQERAAEKMGISRPTFQRVLAVARQKLADAVLNGKAIRIEGGDFEIAFGRFRCRNGHMWEAPFESGPGVVAGVCPECSDKEVEQLPLPMQVAAPGWQHGWHHRAGRSPWGRGHPWKE